jgi:hypothetical protein
MPGSVMFAGARGHGASYGLGGTVVIPRLRILVLGTQGSGKGTESRHLAQRLVVPDISTGTNFGPRSATTQPEHAKSGR